MMIINKCSAFLFCTCVIAPPYLPQPRGNGSVVRKETNKNKVMLSQNNTVTLTCNRASGDYAVRDSNCNG